MDAIADSAKMAEQQRLVDKAMHVNLVDGGSEGNVFPGKSSHITSLVTTHNPISDDIIGQNLLTSSGASSLQYKTNKDKYKRDNYIFDNAVVLVFLGLVNVGAIIIFGVIG